MASKAFLNDIQLHTLADEIGLEKDKIAAHLGISSSELERIHRDQMGNSHNENFQILRKWRDMSRLNDAGKKQELQEALQKYTPFKLVEMVEDFFNGYEGEVMIYNGAEAVSVQESQQNIKLDTRKKVYKEPFLSHAALPDYYNMTYDNGPGLLVLFVNFTGDLAGYTIDVGKIRAFFRSKLRYPPQNIVEYKDLCKEQFSEKLKEVQTILCERPELKRLYTFILSHGSKEGVWMCKRGNCSEAEETDGNPLSFEEILKAFEHDKMRTLKDKPKMLFIQTCRGKDDLQSASGSSKSTGPVVSAAIKEISLSLGSDILIGYATLYNYMSWVHRAEGSFYIQAIMEEFNQHYEDKEVTDMLRAVNYKLSRHESKQMSEYVSRLTKKVFLS